MWVRKRFDIGWSDICYGIVRSCWLADRANTLRRVEGEWSNADDALACLSVRSGFDLLLQTADWPKGSEVLMSALTIPDMVRIVKHHEHTAIPIDLDMSCLAPKLDNIRSAINSKTKAIVIAHLFGTRVPLDPIIELAAAGGAATIARVDTSGQGAAQPRCSSCLHAGRHRRRHGGRRCCGPGHDTRCGRRRRNPRSPIGVARRTRRNDTSRHLRPRRDGPAERRAYRCGHVERQRNRDWLRHLGRWTNRDQRARCR
jgi:hypothetical protein